MARNVIRNLTEGVDKTPIPCYNIDTNKGKELIKMKLVYDCEQSICLGTRGEFKHTSISNHLHLFDAKQALDHTNRTYYKTFEEFFEDCVEGKVRNANPYLGLFKVPKVQIHCGIYWFTITKRNFPDEICVWNHAKNVSHYSMQTLMEELPADEFAEYLRERNIALPTKN
jgi:hypothetical protein